MNFTHFFSSIHSIFLEPLLCAWYWQGPEEFKDVENAVFTGTSPSWSLKTGKGHQERRAEVQTERRFDREGTSEEEAQGQGRQAASAAAGHWEAPNTQVRGF